MYICIHVYNRFKQLKDEVYLYLKKKNAQTNNLSFNNIFS